MVINGYDGYQKALGSPLETERVKGFISFTRSGNFDSLSATIKIRKREGELS